ncbi:acetolactate synthase large subunit [Salinisphaera hydrothermalis]|uniref:Acetolactate synthase n=1 Tax=Salinisphaera hydrothermalis (strain C41B8) TaxID=1304275 RepID=A0A084IQN2_SALHC|nr:acetolactate synthase large subunit [Salinisphaera hydrothermalis]KEZ79016.1 acetolactate synthase [Salinisphaera hydrothermalis C41B8]
MKASDLFVRCLEEEGVEYVFGVPGEENLDLIESLRGSRIQLVVTRHEQHAAFMAATYGRLTGRAGVCLSTLGPGATNLLTGIAYAQLGGMPLLAITGQKAIRDNRQGKFQLIDVVDTFRPVTKWNSSLTDSGVIPRSIRHAFKVAEAERPGAVHLELPEDIASEAIEPARPQKRVTLRRPNADEQALDVAARMIRDAEQPVIIYSAGANRKRITEQLTRLCEELALYAIGTQMGKGVVPDDHPQSLFGMGIHKHDYVHTAIDEADLVITLGYDVVEYPPSVWNEGKDKTILHIDFVPADPDEYYSPAHEVIGDISNTLKALGQRLEGVRFDNPRMTRLHDYVAEQLHVSASEYSYPPRPQRVVQQVRSVMGRHDIISLDNGIYKIWFARMYPAYSNNTVLLDNALASMGAGLAAAMSAKMVHPDRRVMAICGDGGFMMNSQDMETAVRLGLDLVVLLLRDNGFGFIRWKQAGDGFADFGMTFGNPDFVDYARAYGATGLRHSEDNTLSDVLEHAFEIGGVVLVDCPIDYQANAALNDIHAVPDAILDGEGG